jgi:hypothetical protein
MGRVLLLIFWHVLALTFHIYCKLKGLQFIANALYHNNSAYYITYTVNLLPTRSESHIVKHVSTEKGNVGDIRVDIEVRHETRFVTCTLSSCLLSVINMFILQSWGDPTDISQSVVIYTMVSGCVCVYCWLGNELSEEVRTAWTRIGCTSCFSVREEHSAGQSRCVCFIFCGGRQRAWRRTL